MTKKEMAREWAIAYNGTENEDAIRSETLAYLAGFEKAIELAIDAVDDEAIEIDNSWDNMAAASIEKAQLFNRGVSNAKAAIARVGE